MKLTRRLKAIILTFFVYRFSEAKLFSATMTWQRIGGTPQFLTVKDTTKDFTNGTSCGVSFNFDPSKLEERYKSFTQVVRTWGDWMHLLGFAEDSVLHWFPSAFMVISRERIQSRSREYYMRLMEYIDYSENPGEGHFLERSWYYIFNCK